MSNRQTKEETDRSLGIAPNSAAQDRALIEEIAQWIVKGQLPSNGNDEPWLRYGAALLCRAQSALLAHEQQGSQAAATFTDKSGGERCITCGRMAPAADPPRDDSNAEWRRLTYEAQEQSRRDAQDKMPREPTDRMLQQGNLHGHQP